MEDVIFKITEGTKNKDVEITRKKGVVFKICPFNKK
jgi:hypothetical protein